MLKNYYFLVARLGIHEKVVMRTGFQFNKRLENHMQRRFQV